MQTPYYIYCPYLKHFFDFVAVPLPMRLRCKEREKTDRLGAIAPNLSEVDIVNDMLPEN